MEFGERLKALREEKKITRLSLSNILNVSYSTVSKYETNIRFPDKETLITVANYFNVSLDYLLCRSDIKETAEEVLKKSKEQFLVLSPKDSYIACGDLPPEAVQEIEKFKEFLQHKYNER